MTYITSAPTSSNADMRRIVKVLLDHFKAHAETRFHVELAHLIGSAVIKTLLQNSH